MYSRRNIVLGMEFDKRLALSLSHGQRTHEENKQISDASYINRTLYLEYPRLATVLFLKFHADDEDRLQTLAHLGPVVERCQEALQSIKAFMQGSSKFEKMWKGASFDKTLKSAIKAVEESSKLFKLALTVDQQ